MNYQFFKKTLFILTVSLVIGCADNRSPEQKALELVIDSRAIDSEMTVGEYIERFREEKGDEIKPLGWSVENSGDQKYLAVYEYKIFSFDRGAGDMGFYFEADLKTGSVKNVTDEHQKEQKLEETYSGEKEIVDELIDDIDLLTGR